MHTVFSNIFNRTCRWCAVTAVFRILLLILWQFSNVFFSAPLHGGVLISARSALILWPASLSSSGETRSDSARREYQRLASSNTTNLWTQNWRTPVNLKVILASSTFIYGLFFFVFCTCSCSYQTSSVFEIWASNAAIYFAFQLCFSYLAVVFLSSSCRAVQMPVCTSAWDFLIIWDYYQCLLQILKHRCVSPIGKGHIMNTVTI